MHAGECILHTGECIPKQSSRPISAWRTAVYRRYGRQRSIYGSKMRALKLCGTPRVACRYETAVKRLRNFSAGHGRVARAFSRVITGTKLASGALAKASLEATAAIYARK